jgi:prolipoprotein diacylglyceryltransferase
MLLDPVLFFGAFRIPAYSLMVIGALAASLWAAAAGSAGRRAAMIDTALAALVVGLIGARLEYVLLAWDYFAAHGDEIARFDLGGLGWHGALIGGWIGATLMARWRGLARRDALRRLAWALPLIAFGAWIGCGAAGCAYGREVDTLAHYPAWLVWEARDVYGTFAPRISTARFGMIAALVTAGIGALTPTERRFGVMLALFSTAMFVIGFVRADANPLIGGLRADQLLDVGLVLVGVVYARKRGAGAGVPENRGRAS